MLRLTTHVRGAPSRGKGILVKVLLTPLTLAVDIVLRAFAAWIAPGSAEDLDDEPAEPQRRDR
jgi:hypothetical protein